MTYQETLDFLFQRTASYQREGRTAFKKDLTNIRLLCDALQNPQNNFKSIHIGGTNGKGSTSHILTSILMEAGLKVGTYTSPHYLDFSERIKINGKPISEEAVIDFVEKMKDPIEAIQPSFFELTVAMAFDYFAQEQVDIAVVEVGLGGRLDSTNIINPILSIITNIGLDHQEFLGDTLEQIASEKAGIIKEKVPVIIGKTQEETTSIFREKAAQMNAPIVFADKEAKIWSKQVDLEHGRRTLAINEEKFYIEFETPLLADYQLENIRTAYFAYLCLHQLKISETHFKLGLKNITINSPLIGRWQILQQKPLLIADSCHNEAGVYSFFEQIEQLDFEQLHIIFSCVSDKDVSQIKTHFPTDAEIHLTEISVPRRMPIETLKDYFPKAKSASKKINEAMEIVKNQSNKDDLIVVIGSIFLVADLLALNRY